MGQVRPNQMVRFGGAFASEKEWKYVRHVSTVAVQSQVLFVFCSCEQQNIEVTKVTNVLSRMELSLEKQ